MTDLSHAGSSARNDTTGFLERQNTIIPNQKAGYKGFHYLIVTGENKVNILTNS